MPCFHRFIAAALMFVFLLAPALAGAGTLYKCSGKDGSIAYTGSAKGFENCKIVSTFVNTPKPKKAARAPSAEAASESGHHAGADAPTAAKRGWVYEENRADFFNVKAGVETAPARIVRANFSRVYGVAASTARILVPEDFSAVQAGVESTARSVGIPQFVSAPYHAQAHAQQAAQAFAATRVLRGAVYKINRASGITEYTNIKPASGSFAVLFTYIATCFACDVNSKVDFARTALNMDAYKDEIAKAAADYGVDIALLRAVIHAESAFNPLAISNKGARGLMQLMPGTADYLGVTDVFDATQNIRGGTRYLAELLKDFNGDTRLATAAYNAGANAVQKYHGIPPYDETQVYVQRVATLRDRYQKAL